MARQIKNQGSVATLVTGTVTTVQRDSSGSWLIMRQEIFFGRHKKLPFTGDIREMHSDLLKFTHFPLIIYIYREKFMGPAGDFFYVHNATGELSFENPLKPSPNLNVVHESSDEVSFMLLHS
jgi:hypothetical protein